MSMFYSYLDVSQINTCSYDTLILADGDDERTLTMARELFKKGNNIKNVLFLRYKRNDIVTIKSLFPMADIMPLDIQFQQTIFISKLREISSKILDGRIIIDISCIHIPEIFMLLKYFKILKSMLSIDIAYSVPFEYEFADEPFTSYCSYYGNLKTSDLLGFGGISDGAAHTKMIVFLGFEGVLSSKIIEDIQYDNLLLVNNLPSFFQKYKDISVINNYSLLTSRYSKLMHVPADNPFETYNFLDNIVKIDENVCIAPLSTKPVALGVCLYAITHDNIRIVYPMSEEYNHHSTNKVLRTYVYTIPLC